MKNVKRTIKIFLRVILVFILYLYIGGVLIFKFDVPKVSASQINQSIERFYRDEEGPDRVVLLENRLEALLARLDLIHAAEERLDIAYFRYYDDQAGKLYYDALLEAADRGVKIRMIVDGMYSHIESVSHALFALALHDNINIHIYEPVNLLLPWTLQNRMHDKFMIGDDNWAMIGGRNIQYRFYAPDDHEGRVTNDLDVMILNQTDNFKDSVIPEMRTYFETLWSSDYTIKLKLNPIYRKRGKEYLRQLDRYIEDEKVKNPHYFTTVVDWHEHSYPTNKISLIHNPIERFNKEPWIWHDLTNLFHHAESSIYIQSPYIVPTKQMLKMAKDIQVDPNNVQFFTNSIPSNPNRFGSIGYMKRRENLVNEGYQIYEYQGPETFHGKAFMIDKRLSIIGSYNLDARSTYLSTESMVVIDSIEFAEHFSDVIEEKYFANSLLVQEDYTYGDEPPIAPAILPNRKRKFYEILGILLNWHDFMI